MVAVRMSFEVVVADADHYGLRRSYIFQGDVAVLQHLSDELTILSGQAPAVMQKVPKLVELEKSLPSLPSPVPPPPLQKRPHG